MDKIEELILKDGRFEPPELIVAVKVLHYSSQYLDDFVEQMRKDMSQACNDDMSSCPADCAYSDMEEKVAEVQKQTQEVIEDMGRKFAQKQGHHFTLLLKEELDRRSGKLHSLKSLPKDSIITQDRNEHFDQANKMRPIFQELILTSPGALF